MVLRESFMSSDKVKIIMLACVCPGSSSADHTLNTLRYAERLKERNKYDEQAIPAPALKRHHTTAAAEDHASTMPKKTNFGGRQAFGSVQPLNRANSSAS